MVVKMINWRASSKKFVANITVHQLRGLKSSSQFQNPPIYSVEIRWKGSKGNALTSLRRSVRRNFTKEEFLREEDGVVEWNEEFQSVCNLSIYKDGVFHPWEVSFTVFNGSKQDSNNKATVFATASLNLADFATTAANHGSELNVPLAICGDTICSIASLSLSIFLLELKNLEKTSESTSISMFLFPRSPCYGEVTSQDKEGLPDLRTGSKKANTFNRISAQRGKRTGHEEEVSDGRSSVKSEDVEFNFPLETESSDDSDARESEVKDVSFVRKSFSYGTLAYANYAGVSVYSNTSSSEDEDWIYFSHRNSDVGQVYTGDTDASKPDKSSPHGFRSRLLPWRKRKLSFRSPKVKGEPLLKNYYGEEGGDDIDFDRRQLGSSDETTFEKQKTEEDSVANQPSCVFGDDNFAVGVWEDKEIVSRDGLKKLKTQVFLASIDQRSERAAGESACTALVAVIADWLQSNRNEMPIKSLLDSLIREGSLEWRNLCENETYRERFPDKHFDLETVLEAKVRPLSIVPEKSFVGFFHPDGLEDKGFDFLQGAMSFDSIWDEICIFASKNDPSTSDDPLLYIISWNDHFFVLKIEHGCCYIIDTLGERLYEGCNQAFILKFDKDTTIHQIENEARKSDEKSEKDDDAPRNDNEESSVLCTGKDSCKEYIKSFLAAIPIRELEDDLKKGLVASTSIHHRLQIEFHFTRCLPLHKTESPVILSLAPTEPDDL